jgi:hypothetical protein
MSQLRNIVKEASMEPGSLPIGRLAPRSWSNLLGGSCALPRGHLSALQPAAAPRRPDASERRRDGRPHPRGRGPPRSDARRVPRRPSEGRPGDEPAPDEGPRNRRRCSAAPIRRVPRQRGRAVPHWVAASVRLSDQDTRARAHRRARHHPRSPRTLAAANRRLHRRAAGLERGHVRCFTAHRCTKHGRVSCERVGGGRHVELTASQKDEWKTGRRVCVNLGY